MKTTLVPKKMTIMLANALNYDTYSIVVNLRLIEVIESNLQQFVQK